MKNEDFLSKRGWKQIFWTDDNTIKKYPAGTQNYIWVKNDIHLTEIDAIHYELEKIPHTMFEMLQEFHDVFDLVSNDKPTIPDYETIKLRMALIKEEYKEVMEEFGCDVNIGSIDDYRNAINLEKLAKELCDLMYVVLGTGVSFGLPMDKCFAEVHRSNMSKLDEKGKVLRREDGKVLKSDLYQPANLKDIINDS